MGHAPVVCGGSKYVQPAMCNLPGDLGNVNRLYDATYTVLMICDLGQFEHCTVSVGGSGSSESSLTQWSRSREHRVFMRISGLSDLKFKQVYTRVALNLCLAQLNLTLVGVLLVGGHVLSFFLVLHLPVSSVPSTAYANQASRVGC